MNNMRNTRGFNNSSRVLTYEGLKYVDDLSSEDLVYTYDMKGGYNEYTPIDSVFIQRDGFYNLTELRLGGSNSLLVSPTNTLVVTTRDGLMLSNSSGLVSGSNVLVCIADDIKELNLNVDRYIDGVLSSALEVNIGSHISILCANVRLLSESLRSKRIKHSILDGYIRILEPISELNEGVHSDIWSKSITVRTSYLFGVIECITEGSVRGGLLRLKHKNANFILDLSYLMLTVGIIPMQIDVEGEYTILDYIVPINLRKLYDSWLYKDLDDSYAIVSESRIVKRGGEGTRGIRLYFRVMDKNPIKLSYDYYNYIVNLQLSGSKYCLVSTLGVPMMM